MPSGWSPLEVEAVVADYFEMLALELRGKRFNKRAYNRALQTQLRRSQSAIEMKHQNISAILVELGWRYIGGYKPLPNYQHLLYDVVAERVAADKALKRRMATAADAPAVVPRVNDILARLVGPPERAEPNHGRVSESRQRFGDPNTGVDYLRREARNASLGAAGEEFAMRFERARLIQAGREQLAERMEHVSATQGDGSGFDIRSFEVDGTDRFIEVKTTAGPKEMPFFVSRNQVEVSRDRDRRYHLYRAFAFHRDARLFILRGRLDRSCVLDASEFRAHVA